LAETVSTCFLKLLYTKSPDLPGMFLYRLLHSKRLRIKQDSSG